MAHPGGRPTKQTPELIKKAWQYLEDTKEISNEVFLPTIEGLAIELDIWKDTLYEWAKQGGEFSYVLKRLKELQAQKVMQLSLNNKYNPIISRMLLSRHDYIEKKEEQPQLPPNPIYFVNQVPTKGEPEKPKEA